MCIRDRYLSKYYLSIVEVSLRWPSLPVMASDILISSPNTWTPQFRTDVVITKHKKRYVLNWSPVAPKVAIKLSDIFPPNFTWKPHWWRYNTIHWISIILMPKLINLFRKTWLVKLSFLRQCMSIYQCCHKVQIEDIHLATTLDCWTGNRQKGCQVDKL